MAPEPELLFVGKYKRILLHQVTKLQIVYSTYYPVRAFVAGKPVFVDERFMAEKINPAASGRQGPGPAGDA